MSWYEAVKDIKKLAEQIQNAELLQRIGSLQVECAQLAEENARYRQQLIDAQEALSLRESLTYRDNAYWSSDSPDADGPFCPKCADGSSRRARMEVRSDQVYWRCHVCGLAVEKPGHHPPGGTIARRNPHRDDDWA